MLTRKCTTTCAVPYLCIIACPLNDRLDQGEMVEEPIAERLTDLDEPSQIVLGDEGEDAKRLARRGRDATRRKTGSK